MLEVRDLRVVYANGYEALRSVSPTVRDGEIVAVIGRSGAGKSTLLRCVNGLQPVTAGQVLLDGADVATMDEARLQDLRRACGFIWQEYNLVERLSVMKNVLAGRLGHHRGPASLLHYFSQATGYMPVRSDAMEHPDMRAFLEQHPNARVTLDQLQYVRTNDAIVGTPLANLKAQAALTKVLFEGANVQQTFDDLARELKQNADEVKK